MTQTVMVESDAEYSARNETDGAWADVDRETRDARPRKLTLLEVPIERVAAWDRNPRKHFGEDELDQLAESIRRLGVMSPLWVRPAPLVGPAGASEIAFYIIGGERRWRAAKLAGLATVPCRVFDVPEETALEMALVENLQRQDLDAIEEAEGYRALADLGYTQKAIAEKVNRKQPTIANALRLLGLPEDVRERIRRRELTPSHGLALLGYASNAPEAASFLAQLAAEKRLPVAALEGGFDYHVVQALREIPLVACIDGNTAFDAKDVCAKACPFNAYYKLNDGFWPLCFRPDHYAELQARALAEEKAEEEALVAEGKQPACRIDSMRHDEYERLDFNKPTGCTDACPCRRKAVNYGGKVVDICCDPKRIRSLRMADTRERNARRRAGFETRLTAARARLDSLTALEQAAPELHRLYRLLLSQVGEGWAKNAAARIGADLPKPSDLTTLDPATALRVAFEAHVAWEADRAVKAEYYGTPTLDALAKLEPAKPQHAGCPAPSPSKAAATAKVAPEWQAGMQEGDEHES